METKLTSILVIDRDTTSRNYLSGMLRKSGYSVLLARLGREGLISSWKDLPDIIVFDPELPDMTGLEMLTRLRQDQRTTDVPVIALSSRLDPDDKIELISAGCNNYLTKSSQALPQLMELIRRLLQEELTAPDQHGILEVFLSAKGGIGTSSLCANIAACLGIDKIEARVAVVDLVFPIGSIADIVGYTDKFNLVALTRESTALTTPAYLKNYLPRIVNWNFHLLAGSPDPESSNQVDVNRLEGILTAIRESYDYIIVDLGRSLTQISLRVIQKADVVVLVEGSDMSTAILTHTVRAYLQTQGIDSRRLYTVQNCSMDLKGLPKDELEQLTGSPIRLTIPFLSGNLAAANDSHDPLITKFPNDTFSQTLKEAAIQIADLGVQSRIW